MINNQLPTFRHIELLLGCLCSGFMHGYSLMRSNILVCIEQDGPGTIVEELSYSVQKIPPMLSDHMEYPMYITNEVTFPSIACCIIRTITHPLLDAHHGTIRVLWGLGLPLTLCLWSPWLSPTYS